MQRMMKEAARRCALACIILVSFRLAWTITQSLKKTRQLWMRLFVSWSKASDARVGKCEWTPSRAPLWLSGPQCLHILLLAGNTRTRQCGMLLFLNSYWFLVSTFWLQCLRTLLLFVCRSICTDQSFSADCYSVGNHWLPFSELSYILTVLRLDFFKFRLTFTALPKYGRLVIHRFLRLKFETVFCKNGISGNIFILRLMFSG